MVDTSFGYKSNDEEIQNFIPKITVMGVGGAGCNAVNNMITQGIDGVDFVVANTDAQSLILSKATRKIQLGKQTTRGFGAGSRPEVGEKAAEESLSEITDEIKNANILFLTAGMGGGTGSGALPVIAKVAREKGILTVAIVTTPFEFEGKKKEKIAEEALARLVPNVDSYIVLPNQNLYSVVDKQMTFLNAFRVSDNVLCEGVKNITDLIRIPGTINLDFADIRAVMEGSGRTIIGTSIQEGENRAVRAVDGVLLNPMLQGNDIRGAKSVLVNITANPENLSLDEPETIMNNIRASIDSDETNFYLGTCFDEKMGDSLKVAIIATGLSEARSAVSSRTLQASVAGVGLGLGTGMSAAGAGSSVKQEASAENVGAGANLGVGAGMTSGIASGIGEVKTSVERGADMGMGKPVPVEEMFADKGVDDVRRSRSNLEDTFATVRGAGDVVRDEANRGDNLHNFDNDFDKDRDAGIKDALDSLGLGGMSIDDYINRESSRIKQMNAKDKVADVADMFATEKTETSFGKTQFGGSVSGVETVSGAGTTDNGDDDPNNPSGGPKGGKKNALSSFFDMLGDAKDGGFEDSEDVFGDKGDKMSLSQNVWGNIENTEVVENTGDMAKVFEDKAEPVLDVKPVIDGAKVHNDTEPSNVVYIGEKSDDGRPTAVQTDLIEVLQKMEETFDIPAIFKKSNC